MSRHWPVRLTGQTPTGVELVLRPLRRRDKAELLELRRQDADWLRPWDPTTPPGGGPWQDAVSDFRAYRRALESSARSGGAVPLLITSEGRVIGQVSANTIVQGAFRSCSIGYWVASRMAGRWVAPTAVAMLGDHLLDPDGRALHRIQLDVRPENEASLRVVRKLGMRDEGRRAAYLHIDGDWREHLSFALVAEDLGPGGLQMRVSRAYQQSRARHTGGSAGP